MKAALVTILLYTMLGLYGQPGKTPTIPQAHIIADTAMRCDIRHRGGMPPSAVSMPGVQFPEVYIVSSKMQPDMFALYRTQIIKVLPYVKIAKELYAELKENEDTSSRRQYRHYRRDIEKLMRSRFEKELKDLTVGDGKMLFKLINRETGNNCYNIIRDVKNPTTAWFYQTIAKRWGYDLKAPYVAKNETVIELAIKQLGPAYKL